jgi:hypothetical protein
MQPLRDPSGQRSGDPVETADVMRQRRAVLGERMLDLANPELHILDVMLDPLLPAADEAEMVKEQVVLFLGHEDDSTGKRLRLQQKCCGVSRLSIKRL